jgi:hypothetical protein
MEDSRVAIDTLAGESWAPATTIESQWDGLRIEAARSLTRAPPTPTRMRAALIESGGPG